jgi:hypothetical protein
VHRKWRFGASLIAIGVACGARTPLSLLDDGGATEPDANIGFEGGPDVREGGPPDASDAHIVPQCPDAAPPADAGCENLECRVVSCDGGAHTTLTGRVFDPAGHNPVYDVLVYIPNRPLDPIPTGVVCSTCQAPASGKPIRTTVTDPQGRFTLVDVPTGPDVPLVMQLGKWRRAITIPQVDPCADTPLDDPATMRLPAKTSEGDMPLIAFTSICDPAECFLRHIGIDDSEFVPPDSATGHVHFYMGQSNPYSNVSFSSVPGGNTAAGTYQWWTHAENLLKYDIVFNACECNKWDRNSMGGGGDAYQAMDQYLSAGGRVFATHYYGNWFAPPTGTPDLQSVAQWAVPTLPVTDGTVVEDETVDQSFPKGQAFAQWLVDNQASPALGQIRLGGTRDDVIAQAPSGCSTAGGTCLSTPWIVHPGDDHPRYLSFNSPVGRSADQQCGKAVFSDVHVSGASDGSLFPGECADADPQGLYRANETALEFLFFDLSSCVQDDGKPPKQPCGH